MPPSGHSSSHHRSSSSHSSRSRSSSSRSHSSHSHSSHSSSHHSYSTARSSRSYSSSRRRPSSYTSREPRSRINQPEGWYGKTDIIRHIRCKSHDYDYYPTSWDTVDGKHFDAGYYDEYGKYYRNLFVPKETLVLSCEYCGNNMIYTCKEGELPICSKCGAQFKIDISDQSDEYANNIGALDENKKRNIKKWVKRGVIIYLVLLFLKAGLEYAILRERNKAASNRYSVTNSNNYNTTVSATPTPKTSIYVEEIGRTCYRKDGDWYDSATQCWFWYNDEVEPYQWQYWYEGISSDYGDFGWMEYDMDSGQWYIEVSDGNWEMLPDKYDTTNLWHFTDEYINPYE